MKKQLLAAASLCLAANTFAQSGNYNLNVKLNAINPNAKAYLVKNYGWSNSKVIDSAILKNGTFMFKGVAEEPIETNVVIDHDGKSGAGWSKTKDALHVYLEPGNVTVNGTDSIVHAKISGSALNDEYARYMAIILPPLEKARSEAQAAFAAMDEKKRKDPVFQAPVLNRMRAAAKVADSLKIVYIKQHPDSFLSLAALVELGGKDPDVAKVGPMLKSLSARIRGTKTGTALYKKLYDEPTSIGALAPDFTQNDVNDKPVKLSNFRGKYVLLDFWASWCGPCRKENPNVIKAYDKYKSKNFTVLGVSLDQAGKKDAWLAAIKADGLPWTQVSDLNAWSNSAAKLYGIRAIPQNFLIDPNGKIIAKNLRGEELEQKLALLIK